MIITFRPASLLWRFIRETGLFGFFLLFLRSCASTKVRENVTPKSTLSEHPDHYIIVNFKLYFLKILFLFKIFKICLIVTWNPSGDIPLRDRSQPQFSSSPLEHDLVTACATPALEMAWTKLASLVPGETTGYGPRAAFHLSISETFLFFSVCFSLFLRSLLDAFSVMVIFPSSLVEVWSCIGKTSSVFLRARK